MESRQPVVRDVLEVEEQAVWDAAPIPAGTAGVVEGVLRTWWVLQYRLMKWQAMRDRSRRRPWGPTDQARVMELLGRTASVLLKATEVQVRVAEADLAAGREADMKRYLAEMTPEQLAGLVDGTGDLPVGQDLAKLALTPGEP